MILRCNILSYVFSVILICQYVRGGGALKIESTHSFSPGNDGDIIELRIVIRNVSDHDVKIPTSGVRFGSASAPVGATTVKPILGLSFAPEELPDGRIAIPSESDFAPVILGKDESCVLRVRLNVVRYLRGPSLRVTLICRPSLVKRYGFFPFDEEFLSVWEPGFGKK